MSNKTHPEIELFLWDGEATITGVWGKCTMYELGMMDKQLAIDFAGIVGNWWMRVQITGYTEPECNEYGRIEISGYYEYDILSKIVAEPDNMDNVERLGI